MTDADQGDNAPPSSDAQLVNLRRSVRERKPREPWEATEASKPAKPSENHSRRIPAVISRLAEREVVNRDKSMKSNVEADDEASDAWATLDPGKLEDDVHRTGQASPVATRKSARERKMREPWEAEKVPKPLKASKDHSHKVGARSASASVADKKTTQRQKPAQSKPDYSNEAGTPPLKETRSSQPSHQTTWRPQTTSHPASDKPKPLTPSISTTSPLAPAFQSLPATAEELAEIEKFTFKGENLDWTIEPYPARREVMKAAIAGRKKLARLGPSKFSEAQRRERERGRGLGFVGGGVGSAEMRGESDPADGGGGKRGERVVDGRLVEDVMDDDDFLREEDGDGGVVAAVAARLNSGRRGRGRGDARIEDSESEESGGSTIAVAARKAMCIRMAAEVIRKQKRLVKSQVASVAAVSGSKTAQ